MAGSGGLGWSSGGMRSVRGVAAIATSGSWLTLRSRVQLAPCTLYPWLEPEGHFSNVASGERPEPPSASPFARTLQLPARGRSPVATRAPPGALHRGRRSPRRACAQPSPAGRGDGALHRAETSPQRACAQPSLATAEAAPATRKPVSSRLHRLARLTLLAAPAPTVLPPARGPAPRPRGSRRAPSRLRSRPAAPRPSPRPRPARARGAPAPPAPCRCR